MELGPDKKEKYLAKRWGFISAVKDLDKKTEKPQKRAKKSLIFIKNPLEKYGFGSGDDRGWCQ